VRKKIEKTFPGISQNQYEQREKKTAGLSSHLMKGIKESPSKKWGKLKSQIL